ncbi:MAG: hypothetical protein FWE42_09610 [Defluviitaleaceae bacterium]|nr:hypothetical protein [Defluviitaleaceae bacterium]
MKTTHQTKTKRLFQGMGIGYIICLITHVIAALIPMYIVFPFAERFFGHGHAGGHCCHYPAAPHGLISHIAGDILILTMIIIPVALLTWLGHKLVKHLRCTCGDVHKTDPCDTCPHRKW